MAMIAFVNITCTDNRETGDLKALADSIRAMGLLQPILLKETGDGKYEVVDGRRRFRALQQIGDQALHDGMYSLYKENSTAEAAYVANTERKPLTPAEEVRQLAELAEKHSAADCAAIIGRTPGYVARRLKLANLTSQWLNVLSKPEDFSQWSLLKLEMIAREPENVQKALEYMIDESCTVGELAQQIADLHRSIGNAIFDTAGCEKCPMLSSNQGLLFDDGGPRECMNAKCFTGKTLEVVKKRLKDEKLIPLYGKDMDWASPEVGYASKVNARQAWEFDKVRSPKAGEAPNAIYVCGAQIGQYAVVKERKTAESTKAAPVKAAEPKEVTLQDMEDQLRQKRNKRALELLQETLMHWNSETLLNRFRTGDARKELDRLFRVLVMQYGCAGINTTTWHWKPDKEALQTGDPSPVELYKFFFPQVFEKLADLIRAERSHTLPEISQNCGPEICKLFQLDWQSDFFELAMKEIPESKALIEKRKKDKKEKKEVKK